MSRWKITNNNKEANLHNELTNRRSTTMSPETHLLYPFLVSQCYFSSFFFLFFLFLLFFIILAVVSSVAGLSHLFPICLKKNEIDVVVVNKPVCVDFPRKVMSRFIRTIRVPFFESFYQNPILNISRIGTISWKRSNDSLIMVLGVIAWTCTDKRWQRKEMPLKNFSFFLINFALKVGFSNNS